MLGKAISRGLLKRISRYIKKGHDGVYSTAAVREKFATQVDAKLLELARELAK
jgi:hypothetical protein